MDLTEELKKYKPTSLRVELEDGAMRTVPMPKAGARWSKAVKVLDALPWVKVECLDGKGGVIGVIVMPEDEEPEDLDVGSGEVAALGKVMLQVMQTTMSEVRKMFGDQLKGMADMQRAMSDGVSAMAESYQTALRVQAATLAASGGAGGEGNHDEVMKMMQLAFMMMNKPTPPAVAGGSGG